MYVGTTTDQGLTWRVAPLFLDPLAGRADATTGSFQGDSTAAFGPDGTMYVLYGGDDPRVGAQGRNVHPSQMTVAKSVDDGNTWTYSRLGGALGLGFNEGRYDNMDLAVAPDTGYLFVAASVFTNATGTLTAVYKSRDEGATWDPVVLVSPAADRGFIFPRIGAGTGGVVVVGAHRAPYRENGPGLPSVAISRDSGANFGAWKTLSNHDAVSLDPIVWRDEAGRTVIDVVATGTNGTEVHRSLDVGATWTATALSPLAASTEPAWMAASGRGGETVVLVRYGTDSPPFFGASVLTWNGQGPAQETILVNATGYDGRWRRGDDYGGIAKAADGTIWAAWSDPRDPGGEARIALARLVEAAPIRG